MLLESNLEEAWLDPVGNRLTLLWRLVLVNMLPELFGMELELFIADA